MNILSLFDGMSCGQIALNKVGIKYDNYFASEIKKHAIQVTQTNYPNTIQIGDVTKISIKDLPKIDLLIGGSPCQDFSQANEQRLGLNGAKSILFFEYIRILKEIREVNPNVKFLLENVEMDKYSYGFISNELNCYPLQINSKLVSAQLRNRYYWTNIGGFVKDLHGFNHSVIKQPIDKKIYLNDILDNGYSKQKKHTCLNTKSGVITNERYMLNRNAKTGMITLIFNSSDFDLKKGIRTVTQREMEKLQTVPIGYTRCLNQQQAGNLLGDGWTIDVISHIFSYL